MNALLREERALVSDIPGTTRDTIEEVWECAGVRYRFIDTAGLREGQDEVERMGISRTKEKMRQARAWIYLFDLSTMTLDEARTEVAAWQRRLAEEAGVLADVATAAGSGSVVGYDVAPVLGTGSIAAGFGSVEGAMQCPFRQACQVACLWPGLHLHLPRIHTSYL